MIFIIMLGLIYCFVCFKLVVQLVKGNLMRRIVNSLFLVCLFPFQGEWHEILVCTVAVGFFVLCFAFLVVVFIFAMFPALIPDEKEITKKYKYIEGRIQALWKKLLIRSKKE